MYTKKQNKTKTKKRFGEWRNNGRGKHDSHFKRKDEDGQFVIDHINLFPVVDSHYYGTKTSKKYIKPGLNIQKMYDLYKYKCSSNTCSADKSFFYRYNFNNFFNIGSYIPKSDRCDHCEGYKIKVQEKYLFLKKKKKKKKSKIMIFICMKKSK